MGASDYFDPADLTHDEEAQRSQRWPVYGLVGTGLIFFIASIIAYGVTGYLHGSLIGMAIALAFIGAGAWAIFRPLRCRNCGRPLERRQRCLEMDIDPHCLPFYTDGEYSYVEQHIKTRSYRPDALAKVSYLCYVCPDCRTWFDSMHMRTETVVEGKREVEEFKKHLRKIRRQDDG